MHSNIEHKEASPIEETSEISLRLEQYDDIFSDFDIRPYSKRALSVDFLDEIKRATYDKMVGKVELFILIPEKHKNEHQESVIKERLANHFRKHYHLLLDEKKRIIRFGVSMMILGIISMLGATYVLSENYEHNLFLSFAVIFLEPAAWFLLWEGMDQIIFTSKSSKSELDFYHKMSSAREHIYFKSY